VLKLANKNVTSLSSIRLYFFSYVRMYAICVGSMLAGYLPFVSCVLTKMDNLILRERTFRLDYKEFVFGRIWQACRFNLID